MLVRTVPYEYFGSDFPATLHHSPDKTARTSLFFHSSSENNVLMCCLTKLDFSAKLAIRGKNVGNKLSGMIKFSVGKLL
jgi:hypothetical protein